MLRIRRRSEDGRMMNGDEASAAGALNDETAALPSSDQLPAMAPNIHCGCRRRTSFAHRQIHLPHAALSRSLETCWAMAVHATCDALVGINLTCDTTSEELFIGCRNTYLACTASAQRCIRSATEGCCTEVSRIRLWRKTLLERQFLDFSSRQFDFSKIGLPLEASGNGEHEVSRLAVVERNGDVRRSTVPG